MDELRRDDLPQHARMLLAIRRVRGWSQRRLASELGVSRHTIMRWESGTVEPYPARMRFIRALLGADDAA